MLQNIDNYTIQEVVAEGKNTLIFRAKRKKDQASVIIKFLKNESNNQKNIDQITHEYEILKKIQSDHVAKSFELLPVQNSWILVMEDAKADNLSHLIEETPPDLLEALEIAIDIADAVGEIHNQHIIHKDLKPQNILINGERKIKVIDFGIATQLSKEVQQTFNPAQAEGSIAYISPEQTGRMNRPLDYRTDLYSLGVTLYQLFTQKLPFEADTALELIHLHIAQKPVPPRDINPHLPQVISDIILKCMSKEAEYRYHSAFGLKNDLIKCRKLLLETSEIPYFTIGEKDVFDHFHIPDKLYGRQKEIDFINQCFNEALNGEKILLALSGYSGVGKTSLVLEAQKNIVAKNGRFVRAKFEQFKRNTPYSGLIQAFQELIHQLLGEPDEVLHEWKERLLTAVGTKGQVIIDVIPDLKLIIGEQPPVEKLTPQENANRFNYVMIHFLNTLLRPDQPLVIFIDDFQWADESSLRLLELFFGDPTLKNLLFVIAYRDNEVSTFHPLMIALREIEAQKGKIVILPINPLSEHATTELIQDAFYGPPKQNHAMANLVFKKTEGNPFFALQFLKLLYQEELFTFDKERGCWIAKLDAITEAKVTDNVADLLLTKLKSLPSKLLNLLSTGSVIGSRFEKRFLAKVTGLSEEKLSSLLETAQQEELIIQEGTQRKSLFSDGKSNAVFYSFVHDRIQQAAYSLLTEESKQKNHYKIGKALLEDSTEERKRELSIDIVNHFNFVNSHDLTQKEKDELIHVNLMAGLKAKESAAYSAAIQYFNKGIELLPENAWTTHYEMTMELHKNLTPCLAISGGAKQAETNFDICIEKARTNMEKAPLYGELIALYSLLQDYEKAFSTAVKALKLLGLNYDVHPSRFKVIKDILKFKIQTHFHKIEDIENMPFLTEGTYPLIFAIIQALSYPTFVTGNTNLFLANAVLVSSLSLKHGVSRPTATQLAAYAMALGSERMCDYAGCVLYGKLALSVSKDFPRSIEKEGTIYVYYSFINRWKDHLKSGILPLRQNYRGLLEIGQASYAAADGVYFNLISLVTGEKLDVVLESAIEIINEIKKFSARSEEFSAMVHREVCACLKGLTSDSTDPRPPELTDEYLNAQSSTQNMLYLLRYDIWHMILLYLFGRYDEALSLGAKVLTKTENYPNWIEWHVFFFYYSLTLAATLHAPDDKQGKWKQLLSNYKKLQRWGKASPINYAHYEKIVRAEIARIQNDEKIAAYYEDAIRAAKKNEAIQDIALAYELLGKYYATNTLNELASFFLHKALECYTLWGADAKCLDFKNAYAEYLMLESLSLTSYDTENRNLTTTVVNRTYQTTSPTFKGTTTHKTGSPDIGGGDFDVKALVNASQTLSKEIVLEKLMESIMHLVIINAGADKAFLILFENKKAFIYSQIFLDQKYAPLTSPIPIDQQKEELSLAIVNFVTRTNNELLLNDATDEGNFRYDPYVLKKRPKSILCLPLIQKGSVTGVLYLENSATAGAFTAERLSLLSVLSSQMAISIENAQFYAKLETKVHDRTKKLQERNLELQQALQTIKNVQQQMIQQEKLASLGLLTAGVAHELKNPLNFVLNFSQLAEENLHEMVNEIEASGSISREKLHANCEIQHNFLNKVITHGKRADSIIKEMLMHAYQGSGSSQQVNLKGIIEQALTLIDQSYRKKDPQFNVTIHKNFDESLNHIDAFPSDLLRVFINLFDNAFYALLQKQKLSDFNFTPSLSIKTARNGPSAIITINDNGPGIPQTIINNVFQPFFTTKPTGTGTGLGLSIVYDVITKQHHGTIQVSSIPGDSTEFIIKFPLSGSNDLKAAA